MAEHEQQGFGGLLALPAAVFHIAPERADELAAAKYGDVTSTGRVLSSGTPNVTLAQVQEWASAETPRRIFDVHNNHQNSDKWDLIQLRAGDVVVDTSYKSGTTWLQTIITNLFHKGRIPGWDDPEYPGVMESCPWVDMRIPPPPATVGNLEAQPGRRVMKSHLALDALPYNPEVKYVAVARDVRDVAYSWYNHWYAMRDFSDNVMNKIPGLVGPPIPDSTASSPYETFKSIAGPDDARSVGLWSYWHFVATWSAYKHLPNVRLIHYANILKDPRGEIGKIADFLDITLTDEELDLVVHNTTISYMKEHNLKILGRGFEAVFEGGGNTFINKGTNGRWQGEVTEEESAAYRAYGIERIGEETMRWLETGEWPN